MPKGLGEGRKRRCKRVIYYRLSLFGILLLRFMVSPKSELRKDSPPLTAAHQVILLAAAIPQPAAALPWCQRLSINP